MHSRARGRYPHSETALATSADRKHPPAWRHTAPVVVRVEQWSAMKTASLLAAGVVLLALVAGAAEADLWHFETPQSTDRQAALLRGLLVVGALGVAAQFVCLVMVFEHLVEPSHIEFAARGERWAVGRYDGRWHRRWVLWPILLALRSVTLVVVAVVVTTPWHGEVLTIVRIDDWLSVAILLVASQLIVLPILMHLRRHLPRPGRLRGVSIPEPSEARQTTPSPQLRAIGASGGGIRAAAFVLGGHQAIQDDARVRPEDYVEEPALFAVSGGSYIAAAMALRRVFHSTGRRRDMPLPWTETYRPKSPELERLRRHTKYLFEPPPGLRDGIVSMLVGALVNLAMVSLAGFLVLWVSAEVAMTTGLVTLGSATDPAFARLSMGSGWETRHWLLLLSVSLIALLIAASSTAWIFQAENRGDTPETLGTDDPDVALRVRTRRARLDAALALRAGALGLAGVWLGLAVLVPAVAFGVNHLVLANKPTSQVAGALHSVGVGSESVCRDALAQSLTQAEVVAEDQARVNPDTPQNVKAGACGTTLEVVRELVTQDDADPANDVLASSGDADIERLVATRDFDTQIGLGIGTLLALAGILLRLGSVSPPAPGNVKLWGRIRKGVVSWLPVAIVAFLAIYLSIIVTLRLWLAISPTGLGVAALGVVGAFALAFLVNANTIAMHVFYRTRLADAFAVGINDQRRYARQLPRGGVYRFSDLAFEAHPQLSPRLFIIATVNSREPNEAPTMRGGFPIVFGSKETHIFGGDRQRVMVKTKALKDGLGANRVSILSAVAISGAAISPMMGRYAERMAPYRMLMTLFNIRVGTWIRNPMHIVADGRTLRPASGPLFLTHKPGVAQVLLEAAGRSSVQQRWIYVSDGGHLDNTGLVECVRHCVNRRIGGRIVILDASNDVSGSWSAVADAVSVVRADLGVDLIRFELPVPEPPWMRIYRSAELEVTIVKAVRVGGTEDRDADRWLEKLPDDVKAFQLTHSDFPRASTARQQFGDLEFEAYRALGYAMTQSSLETRRHAQDVQERTATEMTHQASLEELELAQQEAQLDDKLKAVRLRRLNARKAHHEIRFHAEPRQEDQE